MFWWRKPVLCDIIFYDLIVMLTAFAIKRPIRHEEREKIPTVFLLRDTIEKYYILEYKSFFLRQSLNYIDAMMYIFNERTCC